MKKLNSICLIFVFAFGIQAAYSQCCCGVVKFSLVDKDKKAIPNNRLEIREVGGRMPSSPSSRINYDRDNATANVTSLAMRCSSGGIFTVIYKGAKMNINFKFEMDQSAEGEIVFQKGDFIAEPIKTDSGVSRTGIIVRKAESGEMKP